MRAETRQRARTFGAGCGMRFSRRRLARRHRRQQVRQRVAAVPQRPPQPSGAVRADDGMADVDRPVLVEGPEGADLRPRRCPAPARRRPAPISPTPDRRLRQPTNSGERDSAMPVEGIRPDQLVESFSDARSGARGARGARHPGARGIRRSRRSRTAPSPGCSSARPAASPSTSSIPAEQFCYYYAHLERYADGLQEGTSVQKGQVIGYVGTSGNAPKNTPHLHFAVFRLTDGKALVGRHSHRPLRHPAVAFQPFCRLAHVQAGAGKELASIERCAGGHCPAARIWVPRAHTGASPLRSDSRQSAVSATRKRLTTWRCAAAGDVSRVRARVSRAPAARAQPRPADDRRPRHRRAHAGCLRPGLAEARQLSAATRRLRTWLHRLAVNVVIERFRTDTVAARSACTTARDLRHAARPRRRSRDLSMDFETALDEAARRRARDLRAARRRRLQAPRDRDAARDFGRHVEGAAAPRADDAAAAPAAGHRRRKRTP